MYVILCYMNIYLDNCCLNRPFDNQSDPRIHLESEAIKTIIRLIEADIWQLVTRKVLLFEINNTPDEQRRRNLHGINKMASKCIETTTSIRNRAKYFEIFGLQAFDAAHLACAENNANVLLTVDNRFRKRANTIEDINIEVKNPLQWLEEVLK